jgi:osmotically-inducible protein OsmY
MSPATPLLAQGDSTLPDSPADKQLLESVENQLRHNSYLAHKDIRCDCRHGVLTLRGHLPTYYLRQLAGALAADAAGDAPVRNEIEIVHSRPR